MILTGVAFSTLKLADLFRSDVLSFFANLYCSFDTYPMRLCIEFMVAYVQQTGQGGGQVIFARSHET